MIYIFIYSIHHLSHCDFLVLYLGKFSEKCSGNREYSYNQSSCKQTCRSLSGNDRTCQVTYTSVDGCACAKDSYLNDMDECVPLSSCPCYVDGEILQPNDVVSKDGTTW